MLLKLRVDFHLNVVLLILTTNTNSLGLPHYDSPRGVIRTQIMIDSTLIASILENLKPQSLKPFFDRLISKLAKTNDSLRLSIIVIQLD